MDTLHRRVAVRDESRLVAALNRGSEPLIALCELLTHTAPLLTHSAAIDKAFCAALRRLGVLNAQDQLVADAPALQTIDERADSLVPGTLLLLMHANSGVRRFALHVLASVSASGVATQVHCDI